jgi:hypothetical protein
MTSYIVMGRGKRAHLEHVRSPRWPRATLCGRLIYRSDVEDEGVPGVPWCGTCRKVADR